jgi:phenylacetate-CoA ligase
MLIVRGVNVFPSAIEGIVRRFPVVDEFQVEVFTRSEMHELRLLLEVKGGEVEASVRQVVETIRRDLGIRVEAQAVPVGSLPRYELKARRVVKR